MAISPVTTTVRGMVTSATSASTGETHTIITTTPTTVNDIPVDLNDDGIKDGYWIVDANLDMIPKMKTTTRRIPVYEIRLESGARIESDRTVNDYVQSAVLASAIRILSYLICVFGVYIALALIISLANYVFHFPLIRGVDWTVAALFGLARGAMLLALFFLLVPLALTVVPLDAVKDLLSGSAMARHFMSIPFFTGIYFS